MAERISHPAKQRENNHEARAAVARPSSALALTMSRTAVVVFSTAVSYLVVPLELEAEKSCVAGDAGRKK